METPTQIIGIGASAGGLEALQKLVGSLNSAWPLSYIVAQHLSPSHNSMLTELLARSTNLTVRELSDNQIPKQGTIYIIPPNTDAILSNGAIRLICARERRRAETQRRSLIFFLGERNG